MGRNKGDVNRTTKDINESIKRHFAKTNKGGNYLTSLSVDNPSLYVALVLKTMPAALSIDVTAHVLDLSAAMSEANERLNQSQMKTIEQTSEQPISSQLISDAQTTDILPIDND